MRAAAYVYVFWALILIGSGIYIHHKITDMKDPSSFGSKMKELQETIDNANFEVP